MIELRWMKLKDARPEVEPVLQWRRKLNSVEWTDWEATTMADAARFLRS